VLQAVTDANIFVFALNLEYMEADFYSWASSVSDPDPNLNPHPTRNATLILPGAMSHLSAQIPTPQACLAQQRARASVSFFCGTCFPAYVDRCSVDGWESRSACEQRVCCSCRLLRRCREGGSPGTAGIRARNPSTLGRRTSARSCRCTAVAHRRTGDNQRLYGRNLAATTHLPSNPCDT